MLLIDYDEMLQQLKMFCNINSGTNNLSGLAEMHQQLRHAFEPFAEHIETHPMPDTTFITMDGESINQKSGSALVIRQRPHLKRRVLLSGHMDTVYGIQHPFQQFTMIDSNTLNGPGVTDMKGGLVVMLHALKAFEQTDVASQLGWDVVINADEETGSVASSALISKLAEHCQAALVYEPAMTPEGTFAKNRKGNGKITLIVTGVAAHAGRDFNQGRNAICKLAEIIVALNTLNGQRDGVTLNVGNISGGTSLNTVPFQAVAKVDVRIVLPEDEQWIRTQLANIVTLHQNNGYSVMMDIQFGRPVKRVNQGTENLFSLLQTTAQSLNLTLQWKDSGGCCDGNNIAQHGVPILDTMGVRGGKIHTQEEFILLDSLVERATLSTLLLMELAKL